LSRISDEPNRHKKTFLKKIKFSSKKKFQEKKVFFFELRLATDWAVAKMRFWQKKNLVKRGSDGLGRRKKAFFWQKKFFKKNLFFRKEK
jgi:hypothetical protein